MRKRQSMFTIIIGVEGEYGRRLRNYLETHWEGSLRLHSFTKPDVLQTTENEADCWLLGESFFQALQQKEELPQGFMKKCILLSREEKEGSFCMYHPPAELMTMIRERQKEVLYSSAEFHKGGTITAVYSPIFDPALAALISTWMNPGDLYLGMEDIGPAFYEKGNMGDLCYYIGLQSERISDRVKETAREKEGIWYVDSPSLYFDLLELDSEEYQWFFQCLKECGDYGDIYVGLGSGILAFLSLNKIFDRFFLIDSVSNDRQHVSCDCLERALFSQGHRFSGRFERKYREEILHGAVQ